LIILVLLLYYIRDKVLIVLTAVVIASSIEPATKKLAKYKVPRVLSVIMVYVVIISSIVGLLYFFIPPLLDEVAGFLTLLPQYVNGQTIPVNSILPVSDQTIHNIATSLPVGDVITQLQTRVSGLGSSFWKTVSAIFGNILSFIIIFVLSFYFAVQETGIDDFLELVTPPKHQKYVLGLWRRSQMKIGLWMQGQLLLGFIVGIFLYLVLTIFGIRYAFLLAIFAALCELIPLFGPILAAIPGVAIGLTDGGVHLGVIVGLIYLIIHQFENHLLYPLVVKKVVGVPPILVILALIVGGQLAGFLGIILSVPVAVVIQEFVDDVRKHRQSLGGILSSE
jgi:predicted PurR-regulated permease PerM